MSVSDNLRRVREAIARAAERAGRDPESVELVAVSKLHPPATIREAYEAGQRSFGENYVQEMQAKAEELADLEELRWHFIGHLQRNKVKHLVGVVSLLETIDSQRLLAEVEKRTPEDQTLEVLIQVKIGDESTKSGCDPEELGELLAAARASARVRPRGLMVIPPFELAAEQTRTYFAKLRGLRDAHGGAEALPELSMGMSHDFEEAIEEGATMVRVGTAVFGPRPG